LLGLSPQRACIGSGNVAGENAKSLIRLSYTNGTGQEVDFAINLYTRK